MMSLRVNDSGKGPPRTIELKHGLVFGRHPECEITLVDPTVGRYATKLIEENGAFFFEDMGSSNPTAIVDGPTLSKGARARLAPGMRILIGHTTVDVVGEDSDATFQPKPVSTPDGERTIARAEVPVEDDRTLLGPAVARAKQPDGVPIARPPTAARGSTPPAAQVPTPTPTAARPVPAVKPSAAELASPAADSDDLGGRTIGMIDSKPVMLDLASKAALETARPRLVLTNEADRRVVNVTQVETTIGRDAGDLRLNHGAVSSPHAKIRFNPMLNTFQIEDLDSRNKTYVRGAALHPNVSQTLDPECHLQFGPIECVFVVDRDADNVPIPPSLYANALRLLLGQKIVTKEQAERAEKQAATEKRHAGEVLLLSGAITAKHWTRAVSDARSVASQEMLGPGSGKKRLWLYAAIALGVAAILYWVIHNRG